MPREAGLFEAANGSVSDVYQGKRFVAGIAVQEKRLTERMAA